MSYTHGAYGNVIKNPDKAAVQTGAAPVYIGTAPVHTVPGGDKNINVPVLVKSFADAVAKFGYSDDWASYTLCEAMHVHFNKVGVGPIILINVLNVTDLTAATGGTATKTPVNGRVIIDDAGEIVLDSLTITDKTLGTHYTIAYDHVGKRIILQEKTLGGLGSTELSIAYDLIDPSGVTDADVIGTAGEDGVNTGIYAVRNVMQLIGVKPALLLAPGFSETPDVHNALIAASEKINGHWDAIVYSDLPITSEGSALTLATAVTWKGANGYANDREKVFFPRFMGTDGMVYHLCVWAAARGQALAGVDGIPYQSPSNTPIPATRLYFGDDEVTQRIIDDTIISARLNAHGITSAAFVGGEWVLWGAHAASYDVDTNDTEMNIADTSLAMCYYITNDFQYRRGTEIDKATSRNRLYQIVAEEQARIDALISAGALAYGDVRLVTDGEAADKMQTGDFEFRFNVTTMPLAKSMTAVVAWTDEGLSAYYEE